MDIVCFAEAQAHLDALMDRVVSDHAPVVISRQDGEAVVMVSLSDWHAVNATTHLLSSEANVDRLGSAIAQLDGRP